MYLRAGEVAVGDLLLLLELLHNLDASYTVATNSPEEQMGILVKASIATILRWSHCTNPVIAPTKSTMDSCLALNAVGVASMYLITEPYFSPETSLLSSPVLYVKNSLPEGIHYPSLSCSTFVQRFFYLLDFSKILATVVTAVYVSAATKRKYKV